MDRNGTTNYRYLSPSLAFARQLARREAAPFCRLRRHFPRSTGELPSSEGAVPISAPIQEKTKKTVQSPATGTKGFILPWENGAVATFSRGGNATCDTIIL